MHRAPSIALIALLLAVPAAATPPDNPGGGPPDAVDLEALGFAPVQTPAADISYGNADFAHAATAIRDSDPALAALLRSVRTFRLLQFTNPAPGTLQMAATLLAGLPTAGWLRSQLDVQGTREVSIYVRPDAPGMDAIVVVAVDPEHEVTVAIVAGRIDPLGLIALGLPLPQ